MIAIADVAADGLSAALPLSPGSLHLESPSALPLDLTPIAGIDVAKTWSRVAQESLAEDRWSRAWATPSTLVAASPASLTFASLTELAEREGRRRGAACPAPIYPAGEGDGVLFTHYRCWFQPATELDGGHLHATAFFNPAVALRAVLSTLSPTTTYAYDDGSSTLEIRRGDLRAEVDAELVGFMSLMRGYAPERGLAVALVEVERRLERLARLREATSAVVAVRGLRFLGDTPVWEIEGQLIVDPPGGLFVGGGQPDVERPVALRRALASGVTTPCTCDSARTVQAVLRSRGEVYSFSSDSHAREPFFQLVGRAHCRIYEARCPHASRRPSAEEWQRLDWTAERCAQAWQAHPIEGEIMMAQTRGWMTRAALLYGREIAAVATVPELAGGFARRCAFESGTRVTLYAPTANLLFITDEVIEDERVLRQALERGPLLSVVLEGRGLHAGVDVDYCTTARVADRQAFAVSVQRLDFRPPRIGRDP